MRRTRVSGKSQGSRKEQSVIPLSEIIGRSPPFEVSQYCFGVEFSFRYRASSMIPLSDEVLINQDPVEVRVCMLGGNRNSLRTCIWLQRGLHTAAFLT